jgi:hypothetical protein
LPRVNFLSPYQHRIFSAGIQPAAGFLDENGAPALTFNSSMNFPGAGGFLIGAPGVTQDQYGNVYVVGLDSAGGVHLAGGAGISVAPLAEGK